MSNPQDENPEFPKKPSQLDNPSGVLSGMEEHKKTYSTPNELGAWTCPESVEHQVDKHIETAKLTITTELKNNLDGEWKKYPRSSDEKDSDKLADDVAKYHTGWPTDGHQTAHSQLEEGDLYIWYSEDQNGNKTVPRIEIRMQNVELQKFRVLTQIII